MRKERGKWMKEMDENGGKGEGKERGGKRKSREKGSCTKRVLKVSLKWVTAG